MAVVGAFTIPFPFTVNLSAITTPFRVQFPFTVTVPVGAITVALKLAFPLSVTLPFDTFNVSKLLLLEFPTLPLNVTVSFNVTITGPNTCS